MFNLSRFSNEPGFFMPYFMEKQIMSNYTTEDVAVWKALFERQHENLKDKGSDAYLQALQKMSDVLNADAIPCFEEINHWFLSHTGWQIETVPGLIGVEEFFKLLAQKKFCSSTWLRSKDNLDYLEEPDMFHDIFGHIPLLCDPVFSEYVYEFGKLGVKNLHDKEKLIMLQRLYWFTIEFGVIMERGVIKSYGAGIISSFAETNRIHKKDAEFLPYDIAAVLQKHFYTDVMQDTYFVINSLEELYLSLEKVTKGFEKRLVI